MKTSGIILPVILLLLFGMGCVGPKAVSSNGESIYRNGTNEQGKKLLDKRHSQITFIKSCQGCHGKKGDRNPNCNLQWSALSDPSRIAVPYTDSLFFRFLDQDLKSDGTPAVTGVHWQMSPKDQHDLLEFLKTL